MNPLPPIRRALVSVSDKSKLDVLAQILIDCQVEVLSTGGTHAALEQLGVAVVKVSEYTGAPEILDGRVKTLHPKIHGGILALPTRAHEAELRLRAASRVSADPLLWENLGDLMRHTGRPKRAVEGYRNAAKVAKDDSPVHRKLGLALFAAAEYAAAVKPLTLSLVSNPKDLDLHLKTARALIESGDFQKAVELSHTAAKKFPRAPELPARVEALCLELGRLEAELVARSAALSPTASISGA